MRQRNAEVVRRLKTVWMIASFTTALAAALAIGASAVTSEAAGHAAIAAFLAAAAVSVTPFINISLKNKVAVALGLGASALCVMLNILAQDDPVRGSWKPVAAILVAALVWVCWTAASWIADGSKVDRERLP